MRIRVIACEVLYRELCYCAARSKNIVDLEFLSQGLHDLGSAKMSAAIQERIDAVDCERYGAIALGFALCNNGVVGLRPPVRHGPSSPAHDSHGQDARATTHGQDARATGGVPLIVPRAHDCITLFFGSHRRYMEYFNSNPGTYFMTTGWLERDKENLLDCGGGVMGQLGISRTYQEYVDKYGEDNAKYLMETLGDWTRNYRQMTHIDMGIADETAVRGHAESEAAKHNWKIETVPGDLGLLQRLLDGPWGENEFLTVGPGRQIVATADERILGVK